MKYCEHCGQENSSSSNFCQACGKKMNTNNNSKQKKERQPQKKGSKKVLYSILAFLVIILAGAGYIFKDTLFYSKDTFMKEYNSAVDNANSGNFSEAKNILNQIKDKDKYDDVNVEEDIRIVADLSTIDKLLQNENATELNTKVTEFKKDYKTSTSRFIESGNSLITDANTYKKYSDGLTEFNQYLDKDDITNAKTSLDTLKNYKFNSSKLSEKIKSNLADLEKKLDKQEKSIKYKQTAKAEEKAKEAQATATSGGISDNDTIPAGTSVVFSGAIANSTTYKEFRQTNAYKTIATNYVGFNATNAEIKACLEWLIQKGKEGYQALPSTEEYRSAFGR